MKRRAFVLALSSGLAATPAGVLRAQPRPARIAWVGTWFSATTAAFLLDAFREGMRELGYVEGRNLTLDFRWTQGFSAEEAAKLTSDLLRSRVDVFIAYGAAIAGVKEAAGSVPVVFGFSGDPVAAGLVASLGRPGGNLTGMTLLSVDLAGKRVELLREAAPRAVRVALLTNPGHAGEEDELRESQKAAERLGLVLRPFPVRSAPEVATALDAIARDRIEAIVALSSYAIMSARNAIAEFAVRQRIPAMSGWEDFAVAGNLISYGPDLQHVWRRIPVYVDKILKGAKPADLPVEQPTKVRLVINLKTARAIGLAMPPSLVVRADRLIE